MEKIQVVLALINTKSGKHIVIHRKNEENYGLPGGKVKIGESRLQGLFREVGEECGLIGFKNDSFELINIQKRVENNQEIEVSTFGCTLILSDDVPLYTAETHIKPMLMKPSQFYQLTKFKEFYKNLFPQ
jgi:ADP-ribose pyrophosphatase YjhB (NUDIX family)